MKTKYYGLKNIQNDNILTVDIRIRRRTGNVIKIAYVLSENGEIPWLVSRREIVEDILSGKVKCEWWESTPTNPCIPEDVKKYKIFENTI